MKYNSSEAVHTHLAKTGFHSNSPFTFSPDSPTPPKVALPHRSLAAPNETQSIPNPRPTPKYFLKKNLNSSKLCHHLQPTLQSPYGSLQKKTDFFCSTFSSLPAIICLLFVVCCYDIKRFNGCCGVYFLPTFPPRIISLQTRLVLLLRAIPTILFHAVKKSLSPFFHTSTLPPSFSLPHAE